MTSLPESSPSGTTNKWDRRDKKRRKHMPVHGRGLEHIIKGIVKRGKRAARLG